MKIAVNTPNGNIGKVVVNELLGAAQEVILLTRSPAKTKHFAERGAVVHEGNLENEAFVIEATRGADALFWVTPGDYAADDFRAYQNKLGRIAASAIRTNKIPRVVNLSSVGAHLPGGTGPIAGLHDVETILDATGAHVTHLRPGYFMENFLMGVDGIAAEGAVFLPVPGNTRVEMIATADIAHEAARRLLDDTWTGRSVIELTGPEDVTFDGAARVLGRAIGKDIIHVPVPADHSRTAMKTMGMSADVADKFIEMHDAFAAGKIVPEATPVRATTTLASFAESVFRPAYEQITQSGD